MTIKCESRDEPRRPGRSNLGWFAVSAAAVAAVASTALIVDGWMATHASAPEVRTPEVRTIDAVGFAKHPLQADRLSWEIVVSTSGADRATALRRLAVDSTRLREFLVTHELAAPEMWFDVAEAEEETETAIRRDSDGDEEEFEKRIGYAATQTLKVSSRDLPRVLRAARALASRPDLGLELSFEEPTCSYAGLEAVGDELLAAAQRDVRIRALAAVAAIGRAQLGVLVTTDLGSLTTEPGHGAASSCEGGVAIATVTATFTFE